MIIKIGEDFRLPYRNDKEYFKALMKAGVEYNKEKWRFKVIDVMDVPAVTKVLDKYFTNFEFSTNCNKCGQEIVALKLEKAIKEHKAKVHTGLMEYLNPVEVPADVREVLVLFMCSLYVGVHKYWESKGYKKICRKCGTKMKVKHSDIDSRRFRTADLQLTHICLDGKRINTTINWYTAEQLDKIAEDNKEDLRHIWVLEK